jgi:hypothetical protein
MAQAQLPRVQYDLIRLAGGLDQVTPTLTLPPGFARKAANFECNVSGGYTRIAGYERFDGRAKPSAALYNILICSLTGSVSVGNTIVGMTSAATGKVIVSDNGTIVVTRQTGTFVEQEGVSVSAVQVGTITELQGVSADGLTDAQYRNLAADEYRSSIQAVPGAGNVLGVALYNGEVYAWRNAIGGASAAMFKATSSGWTQVTLGKELAFTNGTIDIPEGATVTGQTSGATGVVARTVLQAGSWGGATLASGRLILSSSTGTFSTGENLRIGSTTHAHAGGAATQITLLPNGRYETVVANFGGGDANYRMYGCDGVNRAFEFDGTVFVPIATTMPNDTPTHVAVHKQHLFLSFGASLQFSGLGYPYQWDPVLGAGEIAMNAPITNLIPLPGDQSSGALGVYTRRDTSVLYGTSEANFSLSTFNTGTGAVPYTAQNMDQAYVLDDRGIISLGTTLNFGNFLPASLTMNLRPFLEQRINSATASSLNRNKGQYRVFFSDGTAIYMTMVNGKLLGTMPIELLDPALCCTEGEDVNGSAVSFFGSDNGFVYQLDKGTSFDGDPIAASVNLVYDSMKSPRILKRFRRASVELAGNYYAEIQFGYDLGYRRSEIPQPLDATYETDLRSSYWDSMIWDNFVWDGSDVTPSEIEVSGTAENIAIRVSCASDLFEPFTVNTIIVHYTMRRGLR